jgi:DNA-binding transcriptional MerR regulator
LDKAPDAFRTISEVAEEINVPQHVLRFWESRFVQIRPLKRGGGRRYYRPEDVDLLRGVRHLLYGEGYTIRGVQRILRQEGLAFVQDAWRPGAELPPPEADDIEADAIEAPAGPAVEREPSFFGPASRPAEPVGEPPDTRGEPTIIPPPQHIGLDSEDRRKLQSALDELIACRQLIDAALSDHAIAED